LCNEKRDEPPIHPAATAIECTFLVAQAWLQPLAIHYFCISSARMLMFSLALPSQFHQNRQLSHRPVRYERQPSLPPIRQCCSKGRASSAPSPLPLLQPPQPLRRHDPDLSRYLRFQPAKQDQLLLLCIVVVKQAG